MQEVRTYYVSEGNTVRQPDIVLSPARSLPTRELREREKREEAEARLKVTNRRRKAALRKNRILTGYMVTVVLAACFMLVVYVSLQNSVTTRLNNIAALQNELSELNADNNAAESRISTSTNLSDVKEAAINRLGMVYATSSQIVYYNTDTSDYMSQYHDIP